MNGASFARLNGQHRIEEDGNMPAYKLDDDKAWPIIYVRGYAGAAK